MPGVGGGRPQVGFPVENGAGQGAERVGAAGGGEAAEHGTHKRLLADAVGDGHGGPFGQYPAG